MKRIALTISLAFSLIFAWQTAAQAEMTYPSQDSKALMFQDMLMLFLLEPIDTAVNDYYSKSLYDNPLVYPYQIDIIKMNRVGGFRTFHFMITVEVTPVVGPHISVGKDRLSLEISPTIPDQVKVVEFEHLETHELPPNWQHIKKLP